MSGSGGHTDGRAASVPSQPPEFGRHFRDILSFCPSLASFSVCHASTISWLSRPTQPLPGSFCWHITSCASTGLFAVIRSTCHTATTNLSHSYNIRDQDEDIIQLALHRSISVTVGVVWAGIVCRYWWPTEARRELSRALGE